MNNKESLLAGALLGALATALGFQLSQQRRWGERKTHKKAFNLIVTVTFKTTADREKAIVIWKPLAEHVARHELGALLYEASRCDTDDRKLVFVERYTDKEEAYLRVHKNSQPYKTFFERIDKETAVESKEGVSGFEVDYGLA